MGAFGQEIGSQHRIAVGLRYGTLECLRRIGQTVEVGQTVTLETFGTCTYHFVGSGEVTEITQSLLVLAFVVKDDGSLKSGTIACGETMVGSHLLIHCQSHGVVAHDHLRVGGADGVIAGSDGGLTIAVDVSDCPHHDGGQQDRAPHHD